MLSHIALLAFNSKPIRNTLYGQQIEDEQGYKRVWDKNSARQSWLSKWYPQESTWWLFGVTSAASLTNYLSVIKATASALDKVDIGYSTIKADKKTCLWTWKDVMLHKKLLNKHMLLNQRQSEANQSSTRCSGLWKLSEDVEVQRSSVTGLCLPFKEHNKTRTMLNNQKYPRSTLE